MSNSRLKNKGLSQEDLFNFSELFKLMKPRVMSLVIFTCAVGLLTSPSLVSTKDAIIGILLVSLGAGAAGALNMWYESDLDALMTSYWWCCRSFSSSHWMDYSHWLFINRTFSVFFNNIFLDTLTFLGFEFV